jgi:RHS repeat-associated protein
MDGMFRRMNYVPDDDNGNLEVLDHRLGAGSVARYEYGYDKNGMRTSMTDLDGLHDYSYDTLYQIVNATHPTVTNPTESFQYDAAGNRLVDETRAYSYNELNQLTEDDEYEYEYDLDGNMVSRVDRSTGDSTKYTWDIENRLIRVDKPGVVAEHSYGPFGRRLAKTVNGTTTEFRYDGEDLILEMDGDGNVAGSWTFGPGIDQPLAMNRSGENHYYVADGLGSVAALVDETGAVVQTYEYGVFGEITSQTGSLDNPFAYTGREWEPEVGLYYYRARWYDAAQGRFVSEDPTGLAGGDHNLYRYVHNSPARFYDPLGLWQVTVGGGLGIVGEVTLGYDDGRVVVGAGVGIGAGFGGSVCEGSGGTPNRPRGPNGPCDSPSGQLALDMHGILGVSELAKIQGGMKLSTRFDECGVEVGTHWTGGADFAGVGGTGTASFTFHGDMETGEYTAQIYTESDACLSAGVYGFAGVSGGASF